MRCCVTHGGLSVLLIAITPMKTMIFDAIPQNIKLAVTAGIGLFITIIGMSSVGIIVSNPGTIVGLGSLHDPNVLIALVGVILIGVFSARNVKGGIFLAVILCAIIGAVVGITKSTLAIVHRTDWFHYDGLKCR